MVFIDIPIIGARTAVWIAAQTHLYLAAFVLGAPIFIVLCEYLGTRMKDERYDRLAKETMKIVAIAYSLTAISGVLFTFVLMGPYHKITSYLFQTLFPVFGIYGLLILVETILMYIYWYTWESLAHRKGLHLTIGISLNIVGTLVMLLINAVAAFMLTPPESPQMASLWTLVNNPSWMPLNLHRFIANITFGGFMVALFAAFMFLNSRKEKDRLFYDWMGYTGNLIGVGTLMAMPLAGYIYARELFQYDAAISTFMMADKLSSFFVMQGVLVVLLFVGANYYMWLSMQRIEGALRFTKYMKSVFAAVLVSGFIWIIPQNFLPDLLTNPPPGVPIEEVVLPERVIFLGLMMAKALAVTAIIIMTFITYLLYRRARITGVIHWGRINPISQYVLIFISAIAVYLMGLMGAVRELARQDYHIYGLVKDVSPYWYTSPLGYTSIIVALTTLIFFALMAFIFWVGFLLERGRSKQISSGGAT